MDGALTFTHDYVCVDSSRTVLEHHRSFIPSALASQLEEEKKKNKQPRVATGDQTQGLLRKLQVLCPLSYTAPQPPEQFHSSFKGDGQPYTQTGARGVCRDN